MTADDSAVSGEQEPAAAELADTADAAPAGGPGETGGPTVSLVLVGPPGAGKSTIGRKLARELGVDLYDTDAGIEERAGRTIPEIFAEDGEPEFRRMEEEVVRDAVLAGHGVVSLGGGSVLSAATRALLRDRTVVYLEISVGEGLRRTGASTNRPLLNGDDPAKKYRELMKIRRPLYREVATVRVRTDGRSPGRVVRMILAKLGLEPIARPEDSATEPATAEPGVSSRSRARRKRRRGGQGRGVNKPDTAATTTTAAEADSAAGTGQTASGAEAGAVERTKPARRNRRSRRRGGRTADTTAVTATTGTSDTEESGAPRGDAPGARSGGGRRRRASRAAGSPTSAAAGGQDPATASSASEQNTPAAQRDSARPSGAVAAPGNGRSRRARARRARARAREHENAGAAGQSSAPASSTADGGS